jgi:hypothetical protein
MLGHLFERQDRETARLSTPNGRVQDNERVEEIRSLAAVGRVKSFSVTNDAFGDPEVFAIGLDNQVYAERLSANGLVSTRFFLTAFGQVTSISAGRDALGAEAPTLVTRARQGTRSSTRQRVRGPGLPVDPCIAQAFTVVTVGP